MGYNVRMQKNKEKKTEERKQQQLQQKQQQHQQRTHWVHSQMVPTHSNAASDIFWVELSSESRPIRQMIGKGVKWVSKQQTCLSGLQQIRHERTDTCICMYVVRYDGTVDCWLRRPLIRTRCAYNTNTCERGGGGWNKWLMVNGDGDGDIIWYSFDRGGDGSFLLLLLLLLILPAHTAHHSNITPS